MSTKILTIDDSKSVRIIVKKAFKSFDVTISEAENGQEGLEVATKEKPDLILLDVTMPVMDGEEMLKKLKGDPDLRPIPVIMLTAEAGRENVLRIAKNGIRDYIVKPFKDDSLIEKVNRILPLKKTNLKTPFPKTTNDPCNLLIVEDKPAIIETIKSGLSRHEKWNIKGVASPQEALNVIREDPPHVAIVSLSFPEGQAVELLLAMRAEAGTKNTPVFGLAVKTAQQEQQEAQQAGFNGIITKPISIKDMESRIFRALKLDTSSKYFSNNNSSLILKIPEQPSLPEITEMNVYLIDKVAEAVDNGLTLSIIDIQDVKEVSVDLVTFIKEAMKTCSTTGLENKIVAGENVIKKFSTFSDSANWKFFSSVEEAASASVPS